MGITVGGHLSLFRKTEIEQAILADGYNRTSRRDCRAWLKKKGVAGGRALDRDEARWVLNSTQSARESFKHRLIGVLTFPIMFLIAPLFLLTRESRVAFWSSPLTPLASVRFYAWLSGFFFRIDTECNIKQQDPETLLAYIKGVPAKHYDYSLAAIADSHPHVALRAIESSSKQRRRLLHQTWQKLLKNQNSVYRRRTILLVGSSSQS